MAAAAPPSTTANGRRGLRWSDLREHLTGYALIAPAFLIIAVFGLFPIGYAIYMSMYNWRVVRRGFVGLKNYAEALGDGRGVLIFLAGVALLALAYWLWTGPLHRLSGRALAARVAAALVLLAGGAALTLGWGEMIAAGDPDFLNSLPITLFYALGTVPTQLALALMLAYILFQRIRGREFFRMLFFLPYITPVVATAVVFRIIFSPRETSLANQVAGLLGAEPLRWLFESKPVSLLLFGLQLEGAAAGPSLALVTTIIFGVWTFVGYNTVIFLAGLGAIPGELYEAGEIDGASGWDLFRHITLPLLSPVTFYLALVGFIGTLKVFNHVYVMRESSARGTLDVASITIFDTFYRENNFGYAATQAIILFLLILGLTIAQNRVFGERVSYD